MGFAGIVLSKTFKKLEPSVLVLSLPRSGSSWIGEILGSAANALYLREPLTQSNIAMDSASPAQVYIDPDAPQKSFQRFADTAFGGIPAFPRNIVSKPAQWSLVNRRGRRVVIKEVNVLACEWLLKRYRPRVVFLVRHPAAVALSYLKLGWSTVDAKALLCSHERLIQGPLQKWDKYILSLTSDFWENLGALQGAALRFALDSLMTYDGCKIILYEDICSDPLAVFEALFKFARLTFDQQIKEIIINRSAGGDTEHHYGTSRNSKDMTGAWKHKVPDAELIRLRDAYSVFHLPWYQSANDW